MDKNDFWTTVRNKGDDEVAAAGAIKTALIFGAAVIAFAVVVTPLLSARTARISVAGSRSAFDGITTGSIPSRSERSYTVRRSITQPMPDALCIIDDNGSRRGAC